MISIKEESLLQPRKASEQNPDDCPQFELKNVVITSNKTGQNVSLLSAHQDNPLKVTGKLQLVEDHLSHLVLDQSYTSTYIELEVVTYYAFAEYDDGTYGFWAAGKAGWFELQSPAGSFRDIYDKMNEAASIFYTLADRLKRAHRRAPSLTTKEVHKYARKTFRNYLEQRRSPTWPADVDEVEAIFHEHRTFLITSMLEGQDGLDWTQTPMLTYFKMKFPTEYSEIETRVLRPAREAKAQFEKVPEETKDTSRKRKSKSPHDDLNQKKKHKRKAAQQAESRIQMLPKELVPITPKAAETLDAQSSNEDDDANSDVIGRNQKSILQPSGSKYSKKAAAHGRDFSAASENGGGLGNDNDESALSETDESPTATIRHATDFEEPTAPPSHRYLPRRYLELNLVEYDLPSLEPQGPGDLWTCTFEGCSHRVHEASSKGGKTRIKDHFKTHADQAQEKINLALNESRPYLPVNNLVRRLQKFAPPPDFDPDPTKTDRIFSAPIRRRY